LSVLLLVPNANRFKLSGMKCYHIFLGYEDLAGPQVAVDARNLIATCHHHQHQLVSPVHLDHQVHPVHPDVMVPQVLLVLLVLLALQVQWVLLVPLAELGHPGQSVPLDKKDQLVLLEQVLLELLEPLVKMELLVKMEATVLPDQRELVVFLEQLEPLVKMVKLAQEVNLVRQDFLDQPELLAVLDLPENLEPPVPLVPLDPLEPPLAPLMVFLALPVRMVPLVKMVNLVPLELKETLEHLERMVPLVQTE